MVLLVGCTAYVTAPDNVMSYSLLVVTTYQLTNTFARGAACGCDSPLDSLARRFADFRHFISVTFGQFLQSMKVAKI